jgi:hypothetical protein
MTRGDESLTFTLPRNTEFSATGAEQARIAKGMLFFVEHSLKASVFADQAAQRGPDTPSSKVLRRGSDSYPMATVGITGCLNLAGDRKLAENAEQIGNLGKDGNHKTAHPNRGNNSVGRLGASVPLPPYRAVMDRSERDAEFERSLILLRRAKGRQGRWPGREFGRKPKLTRHQVAEALARREAGEALTDIGRSFNVSHSTISRL